MSSKFSTTEHKRVVVHKDDKEWLAVQRLHYTEDKIELVLIRQGDKRLELVLTEEEAWHLVDAVRKALAKPSEAATDQLVSITKSYAAAVADVVGDAYAPSKTKE
jgi:hypothetical protein